MAYFSQQLIALRPRRVLDDHPRGITIEAGVVGKHSHEVFGMVRDIAFAPGTGYHDHRADIAQFGRNALGQLRLVLRLARRALGSRAEDNRFKCLVRTRNMNFVNTRVVAEVGAFCRSTVDHAQESRFDQRAEALFDQGTQVRVHRVGFEQNDLVLHEQLVQYVHEADARDVTCAQYQRDLACVLFVRVDNSLRPGQLLHGHAWLHPDLCGNAKEKEAVIDRLRKYLRDYLAVGPCSNRAWNARSPVSFDVDKRLPQLAQVSDYWPRARGPLFARGGSTGREPLGLGPRLEPPLRNCCQNI